METLIAQMRPNVANNKIEVDFRTPDIEAWSKVNQLSMCADTRSEVEVAVSDFFDNGGKETLQKMAAARTNDLTSYADDLIEKPAIDFVNSMRRIEGRAEKEGYIQPDMLSDRGLFEAQMLASSGVSPTPEDVSEDPLSGKRGFNRDYISTLCP
jgi:hypothetical protein